MTVGCSSLITTERISLWVAEDPGAGVDIPDTFTWTNLLISGETIEPKLSTTVLEDITPERSYSGSILTGGELSGTVNFYARAHEQFYNFMICALQNAQALSWAGSAVDPTSVAISAAGATDSAARVLNFGAFAPTDGATYSVQIEGVDFKAVAGTSSTPTTVATALAAAVDASSSYAASLGVPGASGVVVSAAGAAAADDRTVTLTGLSVVPGVTYTVTVAGTAFSHVALANDTLTTLAAALAALIEASASYEATSALGVITIGDGAGTATIAFSTSLCVAITAGAGRKQIQFASWAPANWGPGEALKNGSSTKCLTFLKLILVGEDTYDWYIFREVQLSSMSLEVKPKSPITGTVSLMGVRPEAPVTASALPAGWTMADADVTEAMSSSTGLETFEVRASTGLDSGAVINDVTLTIDNQLRLQDGVGQGHIFAVGVAAGKIKVTASATVYYASPRVYQDMLADNSLQIFGKMVDPNGDGIEFLMNNVKVTSGGIPLGDSSNKDATVKTDFQGFEDTTFGTITVTRISG